MFLNSWRRWVNPGKSKAIKQNQRDWERLGRERFRPQLEGLEYRIVPSLTLTKTADPGPFFDGQNISYTITAQSNINDTNVLIDDPTPLNTTFVSASQTGGATVYNLVTPPVGGTGNVAWSTAALPAGELDTFRLTLHINSAATAATLTNMVRGTSQNQPAPGTRATATVAVSAQSDVAVALSETPSPVDAGTNITYTLAVTNNGPSDAQNVSFSDTVPAGLTFVSETQNSGPAFAVTNPPAGGTGTTSGTIATLVAGANAVFTIVDHLPSSFPNGSVITDTASASTTTPDSNPANNTATVNTSSTTHADMSATKTTTVTSVTAGSNITYTVTVSNSGPSDAQNVQLTDVVPSNTTFMSETQTSGPAFSFTNPPAGGTGTSTGTLVTMVAGASATFQFVDHVNSNAPNGSTVTNTATVLSNTADPNNSNNSSTVNTPVVTSADISVSKTGPATVTAGANATYTVTLTNAGPSDAQNVSLTDAVPANATFVSEAQTAGPAFGASNPPAGGTGTTTLTIATLTAGTSATFVIVDHVNSSAASGSAISNTATGSSSTSDPTLADNSSTVNSSVATSADVQVVKTGPATVTAGTNVTYTITTSNNGPSDAQAVTTSDTLPANTTLVSFTQTSGPANGGTLAAGGIETFVLVVHLNANAPSGSTITNTANVSSTTPDSNLANNTSSVTSTVATSADVQVVKTGPATVTAGTNITYTITTSNNGPSDAQAVSTTDTPPANTTLVSFTQTSGPANGGALPAGGTETFVLVVHLNANAPSGSTITNTANVSSTTPDPNAANNSSSVNSTVATSADVQVVKTGPATVTAGTNITYTITTSNNGPSDAQAVMTTDTPPANTTLVSFTQTSGPANGGALPAGGTETFVLVVHLNANAPSGSTLTNTANVSSTTPDPNAANNTSSVNSTVATSADVQVVKTGPATVTAGTNVTYTITTSNNGPSDAQAVTTSDTLPANTMLVSFTQTAGPANGGTLPAGGTETFTLVVNLSASAPNGSTITNTANVSSTTPDPNLANNTSSVTSTVATSADLAVTKTGPATVTAGTNMTYTVTVTNSGPSDAQTVALTDATPGDTTFVSETHPAGWTSTTPGVGGTGTVTETDPTLAAGASATFTIVVHVPASEPDGSTITNTATVSSTTADPNPANNSSSVSTTVATAADLAVVKTGPANVTAGTDLTYTITLTNNGPSDAQSVVMTDSVPANTTFVSETHPATFGATDPAVGGTGTIIFSSVTVAAAQVDVFTVVVHVSPSAANGSSIANTAIVSSITNDPNPTNNSSTALTPVVTAADLAVDKVGPATVTAGTDTTYTVTLTNNGPSDAQTVSLTDNVPANTTFVSETQTAGPAFTFMNPPAGGTGTITGTDATFAAGDAAVFEIVVHVSASAPDSSTISNTASVSSGTTDPDLANNSSTTSATVATSADLAVTKTGPASGTAGTNITYTITLTNNGPSDAQSVSLTDAIPVNTTFVSEMHPAGFTSTDPAVGGTGTVTFSDPTFAAAASATFTLVVNINSGAPGGSVIVNTATVSSATADPNPANNTSPAVSTVVLTSADLAVTKTAPASVTAGTDLTYTIALTNSGPSDAQNVAVTDVVPGNTTFVSETQTSGPAFTFTNPPSGGTGTISGTISTFAAGAGATFSVVLHVSPSAPNGSTINNTVAAGSTTADPNPVNNSSTTATAVVAAADLAVTKTGPATATAGSNLTYTITLTNNGPSDAQSVLLTDAVPANTTFVSEAQTSGPAFLVTAPAAGSTGNIAALDPTALAPGGSASFTIVVHVNSSAPNGSSIVNTANVSSSTTDPNPANNSSTVTTTVSAITDLAVTKAGPATVTAGTNMTYTITLTNNGPSDAQTVSLTDSTPAGTTFVSETHPAGFSSTDPAVGGTGTVTFTSGTVAAGASFTFTLVVNANASDPNGSTISNSATATTTTTDSNPANNTSNVVSTTVAAAADLAVTKTGPATVTAGTNLTYTVTLTNNGPSDAQGVALTDILPANTTFVSESHPAGFTSTTPAIGSTGTITESNPTVAAGASDTFVFVVKASASAANGSTISNTAAVTSTTTDPNPANNSSTTTTVVVTAADLAVTKTGPATVTAGANITYTVTLTNNGPSDAQNVALTDMLPANATFVSESHPAGFTSTTPAVGSPGTITESNPTVAAGASATFVFVVKAGAGAASGSTISNTAAVASNTTDPNPANNSATAISTVATSADLAVTKTGPATVTAGTNITYTVTLTNNGPSDAQTVALSDTLPANTTFVSESHPAGFTSTTPAVGGTGTITENDPTLAAGTSATFTFVFHVAASAANASTISNTASATSSTPDPNLANNSSTASTVMATAADLAVTKTGPVLVTAGANLTYTVTLTNNGPSDAQAVVLTDVLPASTTFVSETHPAGFTSTTPAVGSTGTITESNPTLAAGASAIFTFVVKAASSSGSTISNTVTVASGTTDPNPANNTATASTGVLTSADLAVTKTGPATTTAGTNITYTVTLTNNGPSDAQGVSLSDALPANTTFVSESHPAGFTSTAPAAGGTGTVTETSPTLAAGATAAFTFVFKVAGSASNGSTISNTASAISNTADPNTANNSSSATTTVATSADLAITKTGPAGTVSEGTPVTYTVTVTNNGPSDAQAVSVTDTVPAGATFDSISFPQGSVSSTSSNTWNLGTVASGASVTGTVVITLAEEGSLSDTATVSSTTPDPNPANNTASATTAVTEPAISGSGLAINGFEFSATNAPVATFTHANGSEPATDFTATIAWGDGTTSAGTVTLSGGTYGVAGTHTYMDERTYQVVVTVSEDGGATSTTINTTATMLEELLFDGTRGTTDQRFINEIYRDLFGRKADSAGLNLWVSELNAGVSRFQVVKNIETSPTNEFNMDAVQALYQQYLHRPADQTGLNADVAFLQNGGTLEQVAAAIVSSAEYNGRTNGTNDGWLDTFYQDALHRAVDPAGRATWDQQFAQGATRYQVASMILVSNEYRKDLIDSYYLRFLDRPADQPGENTFLSAFQAGATDQDIIAGMISSSTNEFYNKTVP